MKTTTHTPLGVLLFAAAIVGATTVADNARAQQAGNQQSAQQARKPNIVFILADDLGACDLGCYGADLHETPHLDRLARQGMRFTQAYASAPVCSPTRSAVMTGKYPARLHITTWYESVRTQPADKRLTPPATVGNLPHSEITVAELLRDAGYKTFHVGKWHLGEAPYYPETQGFDVNIGGTLWVRRPRTFIRIAGNSAKSAIRYVPHLEGGKPGEYLADRLTDEALKLIEQAATAREPFFLYLAHHSVHTPIEAKQERVAYYRDRLKPGLHHQNAVYAAMVGHLDDSVGRVLDKLDELHIADNTLVIFTSDNGGLISTVNGNIPVTDNFPLRSGKGSLYEGGVRVPLLVRYPGVTVAGSESAQPVASMDFFPTIAAVLSEAGAAPQDAPAVDGQSLLPVLKNADALLPREAIYFHFPHYYPTTTPASSIRSGDWKLIEYFETGKRELYNLADDPSEAHDLSASQPERTSALYEKLAAWRASVDAQLPTVNAAFKQ